MDTADDLIELWKCDIAETFAFEIVGEAIGQWKRGIAVGLQAFRVRNTVAAFRALSAIRVGNTVAAVRALSATRGTISAACGGTAAALLAGSATCGTISIACGGAAGVASQSTATGARRTTTAGCITIPTANCRRNTAAGVSSASVPLGTIA